MASAPYGVRLLVGFVTVAVEETMKLPQAILMYPMTLASQAAQLVMRWQQGLAELAVKGDDTLERVFPPKDGQPKWAMFDEDLDDGADAAVTEFDRAGEVYATSEATSESNRDGQEPVRNGQAGHRGSSGGRFALYSEPTADLDREAMTRCNTGAPAAGAPQIAVELDYDELTLAQLRARLRSLNVDDLNTLLTYEEAGRQRAPFQTLLANRITRTSTT